MKMFLHEERLDDAKGSKSNRVRFRNNMGMAIRPLVNDGEVVLVHDSELKNVAYQRLMDNVEEK